MDVRGFDHPSWALNALIRQLSDPPKASLQLNLGLPGLHQHRTRLFRSYLQCRTWHGPNVDEPSDEESKGKKVTTLVIYFSLDENIREQIQQISQAYPPGTCSEHPKIECFHSRVNGLHFELTRPRKIVWASAICKGTCKITAPPLASNFFKADSAIKRKAAPHSHCVIRSTGNTFFCFFPQSFLCAFGRQACKPGNNLDPVYFRRLHISPFSNVTPPWLLSLPLRGNQPALVTSPRS
ncbi:hypothetical protein B0H14DRAFT_2578681 [Mycena olivaceomarginata]|nr:hypothetical protein B0H14DRAFT_2578681 [Mycena olivaceomarginata]